MKNRLTEKFKELRRQKRCGLIAYVTCGDPDLDTTVRIVEELAGAGADAIELGIPFSDPIADGPVIQAAAQRALKGGMTMPGVLDVARRVRTKSQVPLIAFTYLNPVLRYDIDRFAENASGAGFDAVLITDLPPEDADLIRSALNFRGLGLVLLLPPTSTDARIKAIDKATDSFVYYVSTTGVTGERRELDESLLPRLDDIRKKLKHPIAVGFGVSRAEHYAMLRDRCDAVVVGSAIVRAIGDGEPGGAPERAAAVVRSILV